MQLNSTANSAYSPQWAELTVLFSWHLQNGPQILIFSIALGANHLFELISIDNLCPQFIGHTKFFLGSVICLSEKSTMN